MIGAFFCALTIGISVYRMISHRFQKVEWVILLSLIVSTFISTIAPGNFARHALLSDSGFHTGMVLIYTIEMQIKTLLKFIRNQYLFLVCIMIMAFIFANKKSSDFSEMIVSPSLFWLHCFLAIFVLYFPFALGYVSGSYLPTRLTYIAEVSFTFLTLISTIYTAFWLKNRYQISLDVSGKTILTLCMAGFCYLNFITTDPARLMVFTAYNDILNGSDVAFYNDSMEMIDSFKNSDGSDVIVTKLPTSDILNTFVLYQENTNMNPLIAEYYGAGTILYKPQE